MSHQKLKVSITEKRGFARCHVSILHRRGSSLNPHNIFSPFDQNGQHIPLKSVLNSLSNDINIKFVIITSCEKCLATGLHVLFFIRNTHFDC